MEWGTVSVASMTGMIFSFIISVGLPIALCIIVYKKTHAKITACLIGGGVFIVFAMILERILHAVVFSVTGTLLQDHIVLYGLYGGLAAALFEETGRFTAMRFLMKKNLSRADALMYGIGHGGVEAILLVGMTCINNIIISVMINTGGIGLALSGLDSTMKQTVYEQLRTLWELAPYQFYMAGIERISAIALHIGCSLLTYMFVKSGRIRYFATAFLAHFLIDFATVMIGSRAPIWAVEAVLVAAISIFLVLVWRHVYEQDGEIRQGSEYGEL